MIKKKLFAVLSMLFVAIGLFFGKNIFAEDVWQIKIEDKIFDGINKNGEILIPVRDVFENLNLLVTFDNFDVPCVDIRSGFDNINMNVGQKEIYINGQKKVLKCASEIINGKTFVGLELIDLTREIFGASYEKNDNLIVINKKPGEFQIESEHYSEEKK